MNLPVNILTSPRIRSAEYDGAGATMEVIFPNAPHDVVMAAAVNASLERIVGKQLQTVMHRL